MNVLAINTSTNLLHIALQTPHSYESQQVLLDRRFSEALMPKIEHICQKAKTRLDELSLVVCAKGPGSFTGLRVGMATAKGIALAAGIPFVSISTLEIAAYPLKECSRPILVTIDARKNRFYSALFVQGNMVGKEMDGSIDQLCAVCAPYNEVLVTGFDAHTCFPLLCDEVTLTGQKTKFYLDELRYRDYGESMIQLGTFLLQSQGADPLGSGPVYIRKSDAELSLKEEVNHE
ncbi:MAG: tRNA (adenosine(37)-N6)-threonylcarbamoyltransferase complex dimerization subunit type 1 TsaB [Sphaerochaetaceae bacterium]